MPPPPPNITIEDRLAQIGAHDDANPGAVFQLTVYLSSGHVLVGARLDGGSNAIKSDIVNLLDDHQSGAIAVRTAGIVAIAVRL